MLLNLGLELGSLDLRVQKSRRGRQEALVLIAHDVTDVRGQARLQRRILKDLKLFAAHSIWNRWMLPVASTDEKNLPSLSMH